MEAVLPPRGINGATRKLTVLFSIDTTPDCVAGKRGREVPGAIIFARMQRRTFLKTAGMAARLGASLGAGSFVEAAGFSVVVVLDPADPVVSAAPAKWAIAELMGRLQAHGVDNRIVPSVSQAVAGETCVMASGPTLTAPGIMPAGSRPPAAAESFTISNITLAGHRVVMAAGRDARGLVYALLELCHRLEYEASPADAFQVPRVTDQPANRLRSVLRPFVSEVEDTPWFYDRGEWRDYLTLLATHRFNRFNLSFGMGYDSVNEIRDAYLHFPYPFLLNVPGYDVQVTVTPRFGGKPALLGNEDRARNLAVLQYISAAAADRGMEFQLGLWNQAWNFDASPNASHRITGLTTANHAAYCRDAIQALLTACPAITGVTFRTSRKSGVPEKSYPFWKTLFSGFAGAGRKIGLDLEAEGIDSETIALAQATTMPVAVSPKFCAEFMGLPYYRAAIRPTDIPLGSGFSDLLREDRKYGVMHRIWPGTQRLLLWGDPLMAAAYGREAGFCGSEGLEWMEPLSFRGRGGSGLAGGRDGYAGLSSGTPDGGKYAYAYCVLGRAIYNPDSSADARKRYLRRALGAAAEGGEAALALSSRILPMIANAHMPSSSNSSFWPEMYTNQSIVMADTSDPYSDTPEPKRFGTVSPADPQFFSTIDECADELLEDRRGARYSPVEVAGWLEQLAQDSEANLATVDALAVKTAVFTQWSVDIAIQNNLGRFFAAKFRAGVLYTIYARTADPAALEEAQKAYGNALAAWKKIADLANNVYRPDLTFGYAPHLRGTWRDRTAAIERDIAAMAKATVLAPASSATAVIVAALSAPHRDALLLQHKPVKRFRAGLPVVIQAGLPPDTPGKLSLIYRHVNQAAKWATQEMESAGLNFSTAIPADYAAAPFPLQYYFEAQLDSGGTALYPGLSRDYSAPPYFVIRRA